MNDKQLARFWAKVEKTDGCWLWTAAINSSGYGIFCIGSLDGLQEVTGAHRAAFEHWNGSVPTGLHIHHRCHVRRCVNPAHLEALVPLDHKFMHPSQTHCKRGHSLGDAYRSKRPDGTFSRRCRICHAAKMKEYHDEHLDQHKQRCKEYNAKRKRINLIAKSHIARREIIAV